MKKLTKILFATLLVAIIASCSKENRIERNLYKKGGNWEILQYSYSYSNGANYNGETYLNCGSMDFNDNGTGTATFIIDGQTEATAFTYSNTEDKMTLVFNGSDAQVYNLKWQKDMVTLDYDESYNDPDGNLYYDTESIVIEKK